MWQVDNRTPFAADRAWVRDGRGTEIWLVAVKCTFDIRPDGSTALSGEQPPVVRAAEHYGDPGASSIRYESDLVPTKTTTDVIVVGHAHAPGGRPVTMLDAGFRVGPVQKIIRVFGDRVWKGVGISDPEPFVQMPLVHERAFGGADARSARPERDFDWRNPVGTGFAASRDNLTGVALPNLEYPDQPIRGWDDRPQSAGVGAIASHWQPRAGFAGTYDEHWTAHRRPLLPDDLDDRFYQCAPPDQQAPSLLRGGEPVVLHRLTPGGDLRFLLPRVFLGFETRFYDGTRQLHQDRRLHTVILEPDYPRVSLVWHTALPCHFKVHKLERTIVVLKAVLGGQPEDIEEDELEPA
jgi:hypothetical protein